MCGGTQYERRDDKFLALDSLRRARYKLLASPEENDESRNRSADGRGGP